MNLLFVRHQLLFQVILGYLQRDKCVRKCTWVLQEESERDRAREREREQESERGETGEGTRKRQKEKERDRGKDRERGGRPNTKTTKITSLQPLPAPTNPYQPHSIESILTRAAKGADALIAVMPRPFTCPAGTASSAPAVTHRRLQVRYFGRLTHHILITRSSRTSNGAERFRR